MRSRGARALQLKNQIREPRHKPPPLFNIQKNHVTEPPGFLFLFGLQYICINAWALNRYPTVIIQCHKSMCHLVIRKDCSTAIKGQHIKTIQTITKRIKQKIPRTGQLFAQLGKLSKLFQILGKMKRIP